MVSIEISPILEWAYAILNFAVTWVWIFCLLVVSWILWQGAINKANDIVKGKETKSKSPTRIKE